MEKKRIGGINKILNDAFDMRYPNYIVKVKNIDILPYSIIINVLIEDKSIYKIEGFRLKDYRYRHFIDLICYDELDEYVLINSQSINTISDNTIIVIKGIIKYKRVIDKHNKIKPLIPDFLFGKSLYTKNAISMIKDMYNTCESYKTIQQTFKVEYKTNISIPGLKKIIKNK